jgi:hypothetical protein
MDSSEAESIMFQEPDVTAIGYAEQVIVDLRNRFFDGIDSEILVMQNPMRRLQFQAEQASYERYQSRLSRLLKTVEEPHGSA